jgi:Mg/Co/Ni transporter MgtE
MSTKPAPSEEQLEQMKKMVLEDPNTAELAKTLEMTTEEYAALVFKYLANPNAEPQVYIAEDDDLRAAGFEPPDLNKVAAYINERAEAVEITNSSKFADPNSTRERVTGSIPAAPPATARPGEVKKDLKDEVERLRTSGKHRKF